MSTKKLTIGKLQKVLWEHCKRIIRKLHARPDGTWECYTCGKHITSTMDAHTSHFIPKSICGAYLKYDLRNLRVTCFRCNVWLSGNQAFFYRKLVEIEGQEYVDQLFKDKDGEKVEDVTFHNLVAFSRLAEIVGDYVTKGSLLLAEGRLQTSSWDDKKTGEKKYRTEIIVENVQLAPKSTNASSSNGSYDRKERAKKTSSADEEYDNFDKPTRSKKPKVDEGEVNPEDIPF